MKSFIAALPLLGLAAAKVLPHPRKDTCSATPETIYKTVDRTVTVTVAAPTAAASVTPADVSASVEAVTSAQSAHPSVPSPAAPFYPNGTWSNGTHHNGSHPHRPTTFSFLVVPSSSAEAVSSAAAVETSAAAIPTSESAAVSSSAVVEAVKSKTSSAAVASFTAAAASSSTAAATSSSSSSSTGSTIGAVESGQATTYGGNTDGGMCAFTGYTLPSGILGTALSDSNWDTAGNCGACLEVTGPLGKTKVMVTDQCPGCGTNHLDLYPDAFTIVGGSPGIVDVTWQIVECGITTPLVLKNKEGTSQYWFSIQVQNANVPVSKLEVSTDGGSTWTAVARNENNFFTNASGFGVATQTVRVTSVNGDTVTVDNVGVTASATYTASGNFA